MDYRKLRIGQISKNKVITFAVEELCRYLRMMDNQLQIDILLLNSWNEDIQNVIWVGNDPAFCAKLPKVADPAFDDAIVINISNNTGLITGTNERSVLIAVYRLLRELGCSWVRPGIPGERIPNVRIEDLCVNICEAASYRHRAVCIEGSNSYDNILETIDYLPKIGLNGYYIQFFVPFTFFNRWYNHLDNPYMEPVSLSRSEIMAMVASLETQIARRGLIYQKVGHGWTCEPLGIEGNGWENTGVYHITDDMRRHFALVNGKRELRDNVPLNTNLCYSNPETRNIVTDAVTDYCRNNPQMDAVFFTLADGRNWHCECDACSKKLPADWYVIMLNELDEKLTNAGLDTKVVFALYVDLLWAPEHEKLINEDRFILTFAPSARDYSQSYSDCLTFNGELAPFTRNTLQIPTALSENLAHLRSWQQQFKGDSYCFDYHLMWAHISDPGYERCAKSLFNDMKDLHSIGLNGMMSCQVQRSLMPTGLPLYMMACALWDEHSDFDKEADAYYQAAFGADGHKVRAYLSSISNLMLTYDKPTLGRIKGPYCSDYRALERLLADFDGVISENLLVNDACRDNWVILQFHREYVTLLANTYEKLETEGMKACKPVAQQLMDLMCRNELTIQRVWDVYNTLRALKGRFGLGTFGVRGEIAEEE